MKTLLVINSDRENATSITPTHISREGEYVKYQGCDYCVTAVEYDMDRAEVIIFVEETRSESTNNKIWNIFFLTLIIGIEGWLVYEIWFR